MDWDKEGNLILLGSGMLLGCCVLLGGRLVVLGYGLTTDALSFTITRGGLTNTNSGLGSLLGGVLLGAGMLLGSLLGGDLLGRLLLGGLLGGVLLGGMLLGGVFLGGGVFLSGSGLFALLFEVNVT
jgi:hypothetical protein